MARIDKYSKESQKAEKRIIISILTSVWNSPGYKDCANIDEVWERLISHSGFDELFALLDWVDNRIV